MRLDHLPASVAFCDVETTGLGHHDRIVSFGGIGMISRDLAKGRPAYLYLVFNPGTENHRDAERIHGFSDSALRLQDPFAVHAADVWRFLTSYELVVAHNAAFDLRFINREMRLSGLPALTGPVYCTMKGYRALSLGGSASLSAVCRRIKLARAGDLHGAIEDAWLASTFGCTAARFRPGCAARSLALRPTSVTLRAAHTVSIIRVARRSGMSVKPGEQVTRLTFITMDGRRAAQRLHPDRRRS
jgi:DNA polymerase-3 subunit epsilon